MYKVPSTSFLREKTVEQIAETINKRLPAGQGVKAVHETRTGLALVPEGNRETLLGQQDILADIMDDALLESNSEWDFKNDACLERTVQDAEWNAPEPMRGVWTASHDEGEVQMADNPNDAEKSGADEQQATMSGAASQVPSATSKATHTKAPANIDQGTRSVGPGLENSRWADGQGDKWSGESEDREPNQEPRPKKGQEGSDYEIPDEMDGR
ncbi:uncharacterized protein BROUX77_006449 [Berkeleyomyces rouxiae]|uniref:uncharacterized protein n=1 Tax=Berkeleyomyces rouxiae TaxID=2035830 RepID=UPI003B7B71B2